jgi:hypothetical protein
MVLNFLESTIKDYGIDMTTATVNLCEEGEELFEWSTASSPKPLTFTTDPLVLACGSYRIWKETGSRWTALEDVVPKEVDYVDAASLQSYYRERMVFDALKKTSGQHTSEFRRKLALLVTNDLVITKQEIGMLLRMPYFYEEDQAVDSIVANARDIKEIIRGRQAQEGEFTLIKRVLRSRRQGEYYDYWMTSDISPGLFKLVVKSDNVLRGLVESLLENPVKLKANIYTKHMRGFYRNRLVHQVVFTGTV